MLMTVPLSLCAFTPEVRAQNPPILDVEASVPSLAGIVKDVAGPLVNVSSISDEQIDPHTFTVDPAIIAAAQAADLLILTGHFQWENNLVSQISTPYITFNDTTSLESYVDYGATLSPLPGGIVSSGETGSPHAYWLLPSNALAIGNATKAALSSLNATFSDTWTANFNTFVQKMVDLQALITSLDDIHGFSKMRAVVVTPPEAYVAQALGIQCVAVLQVEDITISGASLLEVQASLRNGTVELIIGSDVSQFLAAGNYAYQLQADYGGTLIWLQTMYYQGDYFSLMSYNLGAIISGIEGRSSGSMNESVNIALVALAVVLGIVLAIETGLLIIRARAD